MIVRRQHRARDVGEQRKQHGRRQQHGAGIDEDGDKGFSAKGAIDEARPDIDAVGDAAKSGRHRIGNAKADQQAVIAGAKFAGLAGKLGAEQRIDRGDDGERQRARQDHRYRVLQRLRHGEAGEIDQHGAHRGTCRELADDGTEQIAKADGNERIIEHDAAAEPDQQRRHFGRDPPRVPHRQKGQHGHQRAQRLGLPHRAQHAREADIAIEAEDVAKLDQEQQHRGHVLKAGHHRLRREFDQRAEPQQAEQRLQQAAEQDDGEEHQQRRGNVWRAELCRIAVQQRVEQQTEEERRRDARGIDPRRTVAEQHRNDARQSPPRSAPPSRHRQNTRRPARRRRTCQRPSPAEWRRSRRQGRQ